MKRIRNARKLVPYQMIGYQFTGLEEELKNISHIGYITDKDLTTDDAAAKLFSYAQYILAPTILELDASHYSYTLFVFEQPSQALLEIRDLRLTAYRRNEYGVILAKRKYQ